VETTEILEDQVLDLGSTVELQEDQELLEIQVDLDPM